MSGAGGSCLSLWRLGGPKIRDRHPDYDRGLEEAREYFVHGSDKMSWPRPSSSCGQLERLCRRRFTYSTPFDRLTIPWPSVLARGAFINKTSVLKYSSRRRKSKNEKKRIQPNSIFFIYNLESFYHSRTDYCHITPLTVQFYLWRQKEDPGQKPHQASPHRVVSTWGSGSEQLGH